MRIDSATDDTIRVSLTVAIRFTDASVNRYTPSTRSAMSVSAENVKKPRSMTDGSGIDYPPLWRRLTLYRSLRVS